MCSVIPVTAVHSFNEIIVVQLRAVVNRNKVIWSYLLNFKRTRYKSIGFLSCYNYYCYPDKKRPRISQVLVLPPYQKCGHGARLLTAMYDHACADPLVCDITVEDPSENFTRLRNFVDALKCSSLPSFQPDKLKDGFSKVSCICGGLIKWKFHSFLCTIYHWNNQQDILTRNIIL